MITQIQSAPMRARPPNHPNEPISGVWLIWLHFRFVGMTLGPTQLVGARWKLVKGRVRLAFSWPIELTLRPESTQYRLLIVGEAQKWRRQFIIHLSMARFSSLVAQLLCASGRARDSR